MASIVDQYQQTLKREIVESDGTMGGSSGITSSGYISVRTKEDAPIFSKQKMKINLPHNILHLTIANNWLVTLMAHKMLLRLFLLQPDRQDEVSLEKYLTGLKVSNLFLDPFGNHLLIALTPTTPGISAELLYLNRKTNRPKKIDRFRDHEITAVGFNHANQSDQTTGSILLGTSKGLILETELMIDGDKMFQNNWKQVFDVGRGENCPITGIEYYRVPNTMRFIVLVTTYNRLYKFHEILKPDDRQPYLQTVFNSYLNVPEQMKDFHEVESKLKYSKLQFNYDPSDRTIAKFPKAFGWLTEPGIFYGEIDQSADTPQFVTSKEIVPYPNEDDEKSKRSTYPISFVLTDFHVLLLYTDHITAVSLLTYQLVYEEYFTTEQFGKLMDIVRDIGSGTIYVYSSRAIFRYRVHNEHRNVWRMYLEKNEFDLARKYSRDNPAHMDVVLVKQAELLFDQKQYTKSAHIFAETQSSFERICLKFLEANETEALMEFLRCRLDSLSLTDRSQITMIIVWMVELYLTEMSAMNAAKNTQRIGQLQKEFDQFLNLPRVVECMRQNRTVIYDLMASHGDTYNLTTFTTVNEDYESVINQYINQQRFPDALLILRNQNNPDLYYKYCPILMEDAPKETMSAILSQGKRLDPGRLLPTLLCMNSDEHATEIIRYLEFAIHSLGRTEQAIHNFLIQLYGKHCPEKMLVYLETQGKDVSLIHYDIYHALRICRENDCKKACVYLQCLLELWQPAVELSLTFDINLAKQTASQPTDRSIRRKLWLCIAEHEIRGKEQDDVKQALELLKECGSSGGDLLRIEDLLPFFSDFQKIDHFKEAICDALKEYNHRIQEQRRDMDDAAKSAERVRSELQTFRNRSVMIGGQELCAICSVLLLSRPFFVFPCGHKFHGDCVEKSLLDGLLSADDSKKLMKLKQQLASTGSQPPNENQTVDMVTREQLKVDIENILAADCLLCGELMINRIDKPFVEDWDRIINDWD